MIFLKNILFFKFVTLLMTTCIHFKFHIQKQNIIWRISIYKKEKKMSDEELINYTFVFKVFSSWIVDHNFSGYPYVGYTTPLCSTKLITTKNSKKYTKNRYSKYFKCSYDIFPYIITFKKYFDSFWAIHKFS